MSGPTSRALISGAVEDCIYPMNGTDDIVDRIGFAWSSVAPPPKSTTRRRQVSSNS